MASTMRLRSLLLLALLATEWNQNAKDATDTTLFKCKQEVQDDLSRHASLDYTPFDPFVGLDQGEGRQFRVCVILGSRES